MKYIIVLGDGMADEPIGNLGGRTPVAKSPICRYWVTTSTGCSRVEARWKRRVWESI